ncbi:unnamed protein product [Lasius platythorax]|uniref:HTH CENPB-type domain-containing protein n=1 Tax=Lasius platythorax TaxID=488582 RepID=A0AAV2NQA1_9HYME
MLAKKNDVSVRRKVRLSHQQKGEIVQKLGEGISDKQIMTIYKISRDTLRRIKHSVDTINQTIRKETNLHRKMLNKYESLEERLYKWFRERKESGDYISFPQLKAEGLKLMDEYGGPSASHARYQWLHVCWTRFGNLLKSPNASKCTENLTRRSDQIGQSNKKFIEELIHRLNEKNIKRDNLYIMFMTKYTWRTFLPNTQKDAEEIDIQKLQNDGLIIILCTNATGSYKLSPYYFYEYKTPEALKYFKSEEAISQILKTDILKHQQIFADWYNNHFIKSVIKHQQETNVSGKVLLLVKNCKEFILSEDTMQNDDFEMLFFPPNIKRIRALTNNIVEIIRYRFQKVSKDFCTSYDMNIYIKLISESWANCILPALIKSSWEKFLSDSRTEKNTTSTSLVKQTSKLIKNVTEEDTALKEISAEIKDHQENPNTSIGGNTEKENAPNILKLLHEIRKKDVPQHDPTENLNSCGKDEGKKYQEQQENDINDKEIIDREDTSQYFLNMMRDVIKERVPPDNLTEYFNSYAKIKGRECQ